MKLMIDIPEEAYKTIMNTSFVRDVDLTFKQSAKDIEQTNAIFSLIDALDNGTPIPDNATNGDVIKAMYGADKVFGFIHYVHLMAKVGNWFNEGVVAEFDKDWWNAPYQKGGKDEVN